MFRELNAWTADLPAGKYGGVTISDIDLDGRFEALVANAKGPNRVLKFNDGRLNAVVSPEIGASKQATLGILAADVDGDGREELYLNAEPGRLLRCGADGRWSACYDSGHLASGFMLIDRLDNGRYGLVLLQPTQQVDTIELGADGAFIGIPGTRAWSKGEPFLRPPVSVRLDADGDGRLDTFAGSDSATHQLLISGSDKDVASPSLAFPSNLRAAIAADFDNDGFEELILVNRGEQNRLYRIGEDVTQIEAGDAGDPDAPSEGAAVADVDGDGRLELILSRGDTIGVFQSRTGSENAWLRVQPLTRFQAPARGAVVACRVNGRTLVRKIEAGSMSLSMNEPIAHFGLGRKPKVEWVSITWPDQSTLRLPKPDVNCTYSVPYPR